ncbi:MAG: DNA polymerase III subunit delta [bacterium P3]|nr:MAG: DNA polymerase III subunit delta [bacterium P3]KWW42405.1 MAG: DNA polymerase III subunit delta [bacterium F083]
MAKQVAENIQTVLRRLQEGDLLPVYLLTGEENYYIDVLSDFFENKVVDEVSRSFDQTVLYGRDVNMDSVVGMAKRYPVLGPRQLVLVKEAQDIRDWEPLMSYLDKPAPTTVLVFCYRHKKMDKRTRLFQQLKKTGEVFDYQRIYESQLPQWITDYVESSGYTILPGCALLLAESLGNNLSLIANELSKIFAVLGEKGAVTASVVERVTGISKEYNVFELQTAIGRRDVVKCNRIVNYFAANPKSNPIQMVLPTLYSYLVRLMIYIQLPDKSDAATALGVNPFFIKEYANAAGNFTLGKLASCIGYLNEADLRSKGIRNAGTVTDGEILKELVFKIIH